ncbi:MAG: tetratricopeptide repeat protein [Bacteroidia bacterium]
MKNSRIFKNIPLFIGGLACFSVLALFTACSKVSTNPFARLYHNTTAYFNGYYNANKLFKEQLVALDKNYPFPETDFIEVVHLPKEEEAKGKAAEFDKIIKKNDVVVYKHPKSRWVDNARYLNGKAFFYKGSYDKAMQNFEEVLIKYAGSNITPEVYFWEAQTYFMMGNTEMAKNTMEAYIPLPADMKKKSLRGEVAIFKSMLYIREKQYELAANELETNLHYIKGKRKRAKTHYLLAQLHTEFGNYPVAMEHYQKVEKITNDYDIEFKSKIKQIALYRIYPESPVSDEKIYKKLDKMLKEDKNLDYKDQIYYEYALYQLKNKEKAVAMDMLKKSIQSSTSNARQKALSYFKVGQIYFENVNYPKASAYYDSAFTTITPTSPEYKEIKAVASTMKDYVKYLTTISEQDSLLKLANMPKEDLDKLIAKIAEEREKAKKEAEEKMMEQLNNPNFDVNNPDITANSGKGAGGVWYFDDPAAVSEGRLQYQQFWGIRKNEDNWRRNKKSANFSEEGDGATGEDGTLAGNDGKPKAQVDSVLYKQYGEKYDYYKDIPFSEEAQATANLKIENALYRLGQLYDQKLSRQDSALNTFATLLKRYPKTEHLLPTHYSMYQGCKSLGKVNEANVHKDFIITNFPKSIYAQLLQGVDPKSIASKNQDFQFAYKGLFAAYRQSQFETAIGFSDFLINEFSGNKELELHKVYYIRALAYGYLGQYDSAKNVLKKIIRDFAQVAETKKKAEEMLSALEKISGGAGADLPVKPEGGEGEDGKEEGKTAGKEKGTDPSASTMPEVPKPKIETTDPKYAAFVKPKPSERYFILLLVNLNNLPQEELKNKLSDFNIKNFQSSKLKVSVFTYGENEYLLPYINGFTSEADAVAYIKAFKEKKAWEGIIKSPNDKIFFITQTNFQPAYSGKKMKEYIEYYEATLKK